MTSVFEWKSEPTLLEKLLTIAKQQGRSPDEIITEAVVLYLQDQPKDLDYSHEFCDLSLEQRRIFMKLPIEERRRILQKQAEAMATHYQQDAEWRELQAGDLVEY